MLEFQALISCQTPNLVSLFIFFVFSITHAEKLALQLYIAANDSKCFRAALANPGYSDNT
jgi:hypothetical protein